jgi:hypothetical protein
MTGKHPKNEPYLDSLLDDLVTVEPREAWDDVLRRARGVRRRYAFAASLVVVLAVAPSAWAIQHFWSASELALNGIVLGAPQTPAPADGSAAAAAASHAFGDRQVISFEYQHCVDSGRVPPLDQDCWAVFLVPRAGGISGGPHVFPTTASTSTTSPPVTTPTTPDEPYFLVLVNPVTNSVIEGASGG